MKNTLITSVLITSGAALLLALSSCQKDELPTTTGTTPQIELAAPISTHPYSDRFAVISIDHNSLSARQADYNVTIMSDGQLTFTGRANTAVIGKLSYQLPLGKIALLNDFFAQQNFGTIINEFPSQNLPVLLITYRANANTAPTSRVAIDGSQHRLNNFSKLLEQMLEVQGYIEGVDVSQAPLPFEHF